MSQEYTEEKDVILRHVSGGRRMYEILLILVALFAVYTMASLMTFNPSDPSWSQTAWHEPIHNIGGGAGAWLADTLFFVFGVVAYAIPPTAVILCWVAYRKRDNEGQGDYFAITLRLIGMLTLVIASCGLAALNVDDLYYFASGGVIGSLISSAALPLMGGIGATLAMLGAWAVGLSLFTGWSWLTIAEKLGALLLGTLTLMSNRSRREAAPDVVAEDDAQLDERQVRIEGPNALGVARPHDALDAGEHEDDDPLLRGMTDDPLLSGLRASDDAPHNEGVAGLADAGMSGAERLMGVDAPPPQTDEVAETREDPRWDAGLAAALTPSAAFGASADAQMSVPDPWFSAAQGDDMTTGVSASHTAEPLSATCGESHTPYTFSASEPEQTAPEESHTPYRVSAAPEESHTPYRVSAAPEESHTPYTFSASEPEQTAPVDPMYAFTLPEDRPPTSQATLHPAASASAGGDAEPLLGQWSVTPAERRVSATDLPYINPGLASSLPVFGAASRHDEGLAAGVAVTAATFTPVIGTLESGVQIKQGIGPELPRPNPVRIPTRRELASLGIRLPSQRMAEEQARREAQADACQDDAAVSAQTETRALTARESDDASMASETMNPTAPPVAQSVFAQASALAARFESTPHAVLPFDSPMADAGRDSGGDLDGGSGGAEEQAALREAFVSQQQARYGQDYRHEAEDNSALMAAEAPALRGDVAAFSPGDADARLTSVPVAARDSDVPSSTPQAGLAGLVHPFLVRDERPLHKPSTPLPTLDLLTQPPLNAEPVDMFALEQQGQLVEERLADYRVKAAVVGISPGPVITRFELDLAPGVKAARISNLSRDLARSLSAVAVRVVEVIPGKPYVGLELPNPHRQTVYLREVLDCAQFRDSPSPLTVVLGKDIAGQPVIADLARMPHLLVAGTTGSGKSVGVNAMILSMLFKSTPDEVRFIMIDPKMLELSVYEGIPHLLTEVVTDMKDAANALRWCVGEMERRYRLMSALGVRNLAGYNDKVCQAEAMGRPIPDPLWRPGDSMDALPPALEKLPYIVVMVDEFADLMMAVGKKVEELIARLAQKARAAGIHLVLATQRPSVDVITGLIKANIPTRIAFTVSSKIDSRTILDQSGAESLLGMGDMLYIPPNTSMPVRVHGAFVRDEEVHAVVQDWKARGLPQYIDSITACDEGEGGAGGLDSDDELDPLFDQAVAFVVDKRRASISGVQRQFRIGYNRAARIVEQMEAQGIVSPQGHNGNREVLAPPSGNYD